MGNTQHLYRKEESHQFAPASHISVSEVDQAPTLRLRLLLPLRSRAKRVIRGRCSRAKTGPEPSAKPATDWTSLRRILLLRMLSLRQIRQSSILATQERVIRHARLVGL